MANIAAATLISIAVFAFFSYPFRYPFTLIMLAISIIILVKKGNYSWANPGSLFYPKVILIPVVLVYGIATYRQMTDELFWCKIANESLRGKTEQMLPFYVQLHKSLKKNELFLYNYAAELNVVENYDKSIQIALECEQRLADYDLQMLLADNYMCLNLYEEAENHYKKAAAMCPVRFLPLQKLVEVYMKTDRKQKASSLAQMIIDKDVKVHSATINSIKHQMQTIVSKPISP